MPRVAVMSKSIGPGKSIIASNLGNLLHRLALPFAIQSWSSVQRRLFTTRGRRSPDPAYLTRRLFEQILGRIEGLAWHPTRSRFAQGSRLFRMRGTAG